MLATVPLSQCYMLRILFRNFNASVNDDVVTKLFSGIDSDRQLFGKSDLPDHFLDQIRACARYFKNIQVRRCIKFSTYILV